MRIHELTKRAKSAALANGADLAGVVKVSDLPENAESMAKILPEARNVIVVAAKHSLAAISSANSQMAQFDTMPDSMPGHRSP